MSMIISREEARGVLECISPTLARSIIAISIADVRTSRDLAKALNMSIRNAQRVINTLESIKAIEVINYGKQKIIVSLNKHFEEEVLESIRALIPLAVDGLGLPVLKIDGYYREIVLVLLEILGINGRSKDSFFNTVRRLLKEGLREGQYLIG